MTVAHQLRLARLALGRGDQAEVERLTGDVVRKYELSTSDAARADIAHSLASYYRDVGLVTRCETFAGRAIEAERIAGRDARLGNHLMFLASVLREQGRYQEALPVAVEGLEYYARSHGKEHGETRYMESVVANLRTLART